MVVGKDKSSGHKIQCSQGNDLAKKYVINQDSFLKTDANVFNMNLNETVASFIEKTQQGCVLLGDIARVSNGINTGDLSAYLHQSMVPKSFKVLKGGSINKWTYQYNGLYLDDCLDDFVSCGDVETLKCPKLMMKRIGVVPNVCYDEEGIACLHTIHTIRITNKAFSPKYVMALMNSKLVGKIFRLRVPLKGDVFPEFRVFDLNQQIPIKKTSESLQSQIVAKVDAILTKCQIGESIAHEEMDLDLLLYKLYDLTYDEVLFVDPETPVTRDVYNRFRFV